MGDGDEDDMEPENFVEDTVRTSENVDDEDYHVSDYEEGVIVTKNLKGRRTFDDEGETLSDHYIRDEERGKSRRNSCGNSESIEVDRHSVESKFIRVLFMLHPAQTPSRFEVQERSMIAEELSTHTRKFDDLQLALNFLRDTAHVSEDKADDAVSKSRSPAPQKRKNRENSDNKLHAAGRASIPEPYEARKRRKNSFNSQGFLGEYEASTARPSRLKQRNTLSVHTGIVPNLQDKRDVDSRSCLATPLVSRVCPLVGCYGRKKHGGKHTVLVKNEHGITQKPWLRSASESAE